LSASAPVKFRPQVYNPLVDGGGGGGGGGGDGGDGGV